MVKAAKEWKISFKQHLLPIKDGEQILRYSLELAEHGNTALTCQQNTLSDCPQCSSSVLNNITSDSSLRPDMNVRLRISQLGCNFHMCMNML